jgi:glycosyltransferase involved in cell wall biosynthesis
MRIIIFSHVPITGTYGAATSLRNHIKLIITDPNFQLTVIQQIGYHHGPRVQDSIGIKKVSWILPVSGNYDGYFGGFFRNLYYYIRKKISSWSFYFLCQRIISLRPDIIHLNSLVLLDLVRWLKSDSRFDQVKLVVSVRELLSADIAAIDIIGITLIDKFICIDESSKNRLCEATGLLPSDPRITTQLNPFIISDQIWSIGEKLKDRYDVIFAIVGTLTEDKGVLFVIEAFISANIESAVLLVVGNSSGLYASKVKRLCAISSNVVYLGEIANITNTGFFNYIDVIIRGDKSFRTGRTVYESIFSGSTAVLPCDGDDYLSDKSIVKVLDRITFYNPSIKADLSFALICTASAAKDRGRSVRPRSDNIDDYMQSIGNLYLNLHSSK